MKTIIAVVAALLAVPAAAQQSADRRPTIAAPAQSGGGAAVSSKPTRYCIADTITGSRMTRKVCKSRDAWLAEGYDPLDQKRK